MTPRMLIGAIAVLGIGLVLAPVAASARGGAAAGGRAFHGGVGQPLVRPGFVPPAVAVGAPVHTLRVGLRHRQPFRWQPAGWGGWYGGSSDPAAYAVPYDSYSSSAPTVDAAPASFIPVRPPGCGSQTKTVPSEAGGQRTITITRCWGAVGAAGE